MKKRLSLLLIVCMILSGCMNQDSSYITELKFYYPLQSADYTMGAAYVQPESREGDGMDKSLTNMLNVYLAGPIDPITYRMPFQYNTHVESISRGSKMLEITLSRGFATYTGLDLTIACACLTMTCLELTDAEVIRIRAKDATLDGAEFIEMSRDSLLLMDIVEDVEQ